MKRILLIISAKWPEYLIESIVIIGSIIIAIELENWNDHRKERESEQTILKNLRKEILTNKEELSLIRNQHQLAFRSGIALLHLFGEDNSTTPVHHFDSLLLNVESCFTFEKSDGFMKSIIASGKIDHLRNNELKSMIASFDGVVVDATQEVGHIHRLVHERLWTLIDGKINSSNRVKNVSYQLRIPNGKYTSDYEWFFRSREAEDVISNITIWLAELNNDEQELLDYLDKMLVIVKEESLHE